MDEDPQGPPLSTLDASAVAPIAVTERSGAVESVHHGVVVTLDGNGDMAWAVGDPHVVIYPRSALKPIQAAAMVAAGLVLDDRLLAVVCASHDGRAEHIAAVEAILASAGLTPEDLENTPSWPLDPEAHDLAVRAGAGPRSILQNCSGKHAGMLATAVANGFATRGYVQADHPVQRRILDEVTAMVGAVSSIGVDGCGAPAPTVSLLAVCHAVRRLAVEEHAAYRAMTAYPELVGGPTRDVTRLMQSVPGLLVKDGAEGVQVAALPDGRAVAVKVADGSGRARTPVTIAALRSLGVDVAPDAVVEPVLGHGRPVGQVRPLVGAQ